MASIVKPNPQALVFAAEDGPGVPQAPPAETGPAPGTSVIQVEAPEPEPAPEAEPESTKGKKAKK